MASAKEIVQELLAPADIRVGGRRRGDITVHDDRFYRRVLGGGSLALGESYMDGWWDANGLDVFFDKLLGKGIDRKAMLSPRLIAHVVSSYLFNRQTKRLSQKNVQHHYDIGNDLYELMLDPTMTYSCGYWKNSKTLQQAQEAKYDLICRKIGLKKGMTVLDIGCGWGGFAIYAARKYKVKVVGVTLSKEQLKIAKKRGKGLPITFKLMDYRDVNRRFDRVISIGMFEHVGAKNHRTFFTVAKTCLKDDGLLLLHTIGRNTTSQATDPWISRYIFPNGILPSPKQIVKASEGLLVLEDWHNFGADYDLTLMEWYRNFSKNESKLPAGYDTRFKRMWEYYLLACAGSFRCRKNQLWQVVFSPRGARGGYTPVR